MLIWNSNFSSHVSCIKGLSLALLCLYKQPTEATVILMSAHWAAAGPQSAAQIRSLSSSLPFIKLPSLSDMHGTRCNLHVFLRVLNNRQDGDKRERARLYICLKNWKLQSCAVKAKLLWKIKLNQKGNSHKKANLRVGHQYFPQSEHKVMIIFKWKLF